MHFCGCGVSVCVSPVVSESMKLLSVQPQSLLAVMWYTTLRELIQAMYSFSSALGSFSDPSSNPKSQMQGSVSFQSAENLAYLFPTLRKESIFARTSPNESRIRSRVDSFRRRMQKGSKYLTRQKSADSRRATGEERKSIHSHGEQEVKYAAHDLLSVKEKLPNSRINLIFVL